MLDRLFPFSIFPITHQVMQFPSIWKIISGKLRSFLTIHPFKTRIVECNFLDVIALSCIPLYSAIKILNIREPLKSVKVFKLLQYFL